MEGMRRRDFQYEWDIHHALEIGERIFKVNCYMHYFMSTRALELYERVREKLGESKKEVVLLLCFQIMLKVHTVIQMHPDDISGFARLYSPQHDALTKKATCAIELAIINAVGNALHPFECKVGKEGVVDAWQYRLPTGEAPQPMPPAMCGKKMGAFKVVARTRRHLAMMHHWDSKNIIMVTESVGGKMDCRFMTKKGSEIKDEAVRRVHSNFFALCRMDNVMAKMLAVHLHANHGAVAVELDVSEEAEEGLSFGDGHKRLMDSFRPAIESCLQTLLGDAENIRRFVDLGGVTNDQEWAEMDQWLRDYERQSKGLVALFHEWGWPEEDSVASHEIDCRIKAVAEKARRDFRTQAATTEVSVPVAEAPVVAVVPRKKRRCVVCESPRKQFAVEYKERDEKKAKITSQSPPCTEKC